MLSINAHIEESILKYNNGEENQLKKRRFSSRFLLKWKVIN